MVSQFPLPVLSVAADAVRDLEGRDALSGLWTLFTKCKESLQDGRRLENISWRLWYREMLLESHERELESFDKLALSSEEKPADLGHTSDIIMIDEKVVYPLPIPSESTPTPPPYSSFNPADGGAPPSMPPHQPHLTSESATHVPSLSSAPLSSLSPVLSPRLSPSIPVSNRRPSLSRSRRSSFLNGNNGTPLNVGKIIYDMLPSSSSTSSNSSSESSNGGIHFLPGPVLSRKSTSTTVSSTSDINIKTDTDHALSQSAPSRHDPMIQMTPLVPVPSASPPTSRPSLNLADGIRPTKCAVPDLPSNPITGNVIVSCLPTPEIEEDEPNHSVASVISSNTNGFQGVRSPSPSLIATIPASSIPNNSASRKIDETTTTIRSVNNAFNDMPESVRTHDSSDASSPLPAQQSIYTGPPSPSLSDSYANAHPGEVEVKEVGILPSLSIIANELAVDFVVPQPRVDAEVAPMAANQTPTTDLPSMVIPPMQATFMHHQPPTLVVVNPTPNPTPHPTPPATPLMHGVIGFGGVLRSQWLALPEGATGSRQHHLLQAAQVQAQQQALLGPQLTTLRLPAAFGSSNNISNVTPTISGGDGASRDLDRSRSFTTTTGASESQLEESAEIVQPLLQPTTSPSLEGKQRQRASSRDNANRLSISSTASNHSRISNISDHSSVGGCAESTTTTTTDTTVASEGEQLQTLAGLSAAEKAAMFEIHSGGMAAHGMKRLGSLSTLQSMTTVSDRRKGVGEGGERTFDGEGSALGSAKDVHGVSGEEVVDEEDVAPLSPLPPRGGLAMSPRSSNEKRKKRNSAPIPKTLSSALLSLSPSLSASGTGQQFTVSPKSAASTTFASNTTTGNGKRKQITASGAQSRRPSAGRSTSRSRSAGGSSVGQSRSRSREPGAGLGGGGLGMTVANPPPVVAATARKAPMVAGSGRGRAKVVLGRQTSLKAKNAALRRNSSGNGGGAASDNGVADQNLEREREEKEHQERMKLEALEKEREKSLQLEADKRRMEEQALAVQKQREEERLQMEQERREEARRERERSEELTVGVFDVEEGSSTKRPVRFNIGSNSDEGRSAGSGSDVSGARTNIQAKEVDQRRISQQLQQQQQSQPQQQQPAQNQVRDQQQHYPQQPQRQLSKPQLRQLQMMEQLHMQHQNQTKIHPHYPQQQQLQSQQQLQQLQERHPPLSRQASTKQVNKEVIKEEERSTETRKGKEKARESQVSPRAGQSTKPTKSSSKANVALTDDMLVKVQHTLAAPLLPVTRRKIELYTSESESEFETDSEDDGSWSSDDMTGDDEEQRALEEQRQQQQLQQELQQQQLLSQQQQLQRQRQQQQVQLHAQQQNHRQQQRPQGVQRAHSEHYPAQNNGRNGRQPSRAQQRQAQANTQAIVEAAALEAQRQRELFVKLPSSSFQNLANARTKSVGLLSQLLNPNPEIFPVNHPYRRGYSSGEIRPRGGPTAAPMQPLTTTSAAAAPSPPCAATDTRPSNQRLEERQERPAQQQRRSDGGGDRKSSGAAIPSRMNFSPPKRPGGMNRTKSAAALPVSSNVAVGSMGTTAAPILDHTSSALPTTTTGNSGSSGKFRPRARPADAELEDDSGSEAEGGLQLSKSVAHEKLKALAQRGGITSNQRNHDARTHDQDPSDQSHADENENENDVPQWAKVSQPEDGQQRQRTRSNPNHRNGVQFAEPPVPITFGYPYNLPPPAAPSTPRTTRRQMLSNELTEDLRRNLLWERQVSNSNLAAMKRSASGGGSRHSILGGLRPLTSGPNMVQLHAKGTGPPESAIDDDRPRRPSADEEQERRRKAMARNKSWANDYHHSGW